MDSAQNFAAELLEQVLSPKRFKNTVKLQTMRNIGKFKICKIMFFGLNEAHMGAQDLKIGGFGTELREEAMGIGRRTQKYIKNIENRFKLFFAALSQARYMYIYIYLYIYI